jgi:hypothetical protein
MLWEPTHPRAIHGWVPEHRLIVERRVGRFLASDESVHHANGVKDDNRDENLIVLTREQHSRLHGEVKRHVHQQLAAEIRQHSRDYLEKLRTKGVQ